MDEELLKGYLSKGYFPSQRLTVQNVFHNNTIINLCIPLYNRSDHIKSLLKNIDDLIKKTGDTNVVVWIADFESNDIDLKKYVLNFSFTIHVLTLGGPFIIGRGLQVIGDQIPLNEIIYFIDADAVLPERIFQTLRNYVVKGDQFYCPEVGRQNRFGKVCLGEKDHGGKGHIGVYSDDFKQSGGWQNRQHLARGWEKGVGPMEKTKWGGHDTHLYNKLRWLNLSVYRPREYDQYIQYHERPKGEWYVTYNLFNCICNFFTKILTSLCSVFLLPLKYYLTIFTLWECIFHIYNDCIFIIFLIDTHL